MRSHFPDKNERYAVEVIVEHMGSLLSGTINSSTPIRPLHASFRDFLTDQSHSRDFFVDLSEVQHDLTFASLRVMERGLSFNMCDLTSSYLPNSDDPGLRERVETRIPPHLSYACRFWPIHVQPTHFDPELAKEIKSLFEHERLFFWLEVLGLMNALSGAVTSLAFIGKWLKVSTWLLSVRLQARSRAMALTGSEWIRRCFIRCNGRAEIHPSLRRHHLAQHAASLCISTAVLARQLCTIQNIFCTIS
jgi:hypothetical protein